MSKRKLLSSAAVAAMMFLAACGDDVTQPGSTLSAEQVRSMASTLTSLLAVPTASQTASVGPPAHFNARRVLSEAEPLTGARACPEGGHLGIAGTLSVGENGHLVFGLSDTLVDCGVRDDKSAVWTFTSQPILESSLVEDFSGDSTNVPQFTTRQTDVGQLKYSTGSLSGICSIDVEFQGRFSFHTPTPDSTTFFLHTAGSLCGRSLASDTTVTAPMLSPP